MVLRMLGYMIAIWQRLERHAPSEPPPPILPILVCHDRRGWRAPIQLQEVFDLDPSLRESLSLHLPDYRLILLDLTALDERELRRRALTDVARLALWLLKTARDSPNLGADLERWLDVFRRVALAPNGVAAAIALLDYATRVGEIDPDRIASITAELGPAVQEAYMTGAERLIQRGVERGREEGRRGQAELVLRLLERRFGPLSSELQERVAAATLDELGVFTERLVLAKSLEEVF